MINIIDRIETYYRGRSYNRILKRLKGFDKIEGWLTDKEAIGLFFIARKLRSDCNVVEIGSWKGKSTYCIAKGLRRGTIHCIDPFNADGEEGSKEIYENTKGKIKLIDAFKLNLSAIPPTIKINILKGYSTEFSNSVHDIDFLFIDGDHSIEGCKFDFSHYSAHLNVGAYLAFHDYDPNRPDLGPTWVIDNMVMKSKSYKYYKSFDSLTIFKKIE